MVLLSDCPTMTRFDGCKVKQGMECMLGSEIYLMGTPMSHSHTKIFLSSELLTIFVGRPNQVIKRDELIKRVWEDHGVFVGRSLDTYISKLRKKIKEDPSLKLTNIHGVGYKLEVHS